MKKTRLLEIIREEISGALNEAGLGDQIMALEKQKEAVDKQKLPLIKKESDIDKKLADLKKKQADEEVKSGAKLEEDEEPLNEKPNIDGALDFTLKSPNKPITPDNINQGALQRSIDNAVEAIKKEYPEYNSNKLSNLIMKVNGKKELKADSFSPEILKALKTVKDTIEQQYDVFGDYPEAKAKLNQFIKDYKTEINPSAKDQLEKFASGDKKFTDVMGYNQTETAAEKALGIKPKKAANIISTGSSTEKKTTTSKPKAEKAASTGTKERPAGTKKATLTPGDDGFDKVTYSDEEVEDTFDNETAPAGDTEMEKAARGTDELIKQYRNVMDTYKSMKATDEKGAMDFLKSKQDIVKKYLKVKKGNF